MQSKLIDKSSVAAVDREGLSSVKVLLRSESCPRVETRGNVDPAFAYAEFLPHDLCPEWNASPAPGT